MSHLVDFDDQPIIDVWGQLVRARRIQGERVTVALVELAPDADVPGHVHEAEQLGLCITGSIRFTIGDEVRVLGPGGTWRIPSNVHHQATAGPAGAVVVDVFSPTRSDWDALPSHPASPAPWPGRR